MPPIAIDLAVPGIPQDACRHGLRCRAERPVQQQGEPHAGFAELDGHILFRHADVVIRQPVAAARVRFRKLTVGLVPGQLE
jgi:hypothetical protein